MAKNTFRIPPPQGNVKPAAYIFALGVPEKAKINGFSQVQFCGLRLQNSRDVFQIHPNTLIILQGKGDKPDFDGHKRKKY